MIIMYNNNFGIYILYIFASCKKWTRSSLSRRVFEAELANNVSTCVSNRPFTNIISCSLPYSQRLSPREHTDHFSVSKRLKEIFSVLSCVCRRALCPCIPGNATRSIRVTIIGVVRKIID
jgi:hypothetical protein